MTTLKMDASDKASLMGVWDDQRVAVDEDCTAQRLFENSQFW